MRGKKRAPLEPVDWRMYGYDLVAGVDEAGRGCLAGPVFSAAVILKPDFSLPKLTDSKLLTAETRDELAITIKKEAAAYCVAIGTVREIEEINILQASLLSMRRAVEGLKLKPEMVLIDGNKKIGGPWLQDTLVKGDLRCLPISAASILAKTARDDFMAKLDKKYPGYDLAAHKGYPTPIHKKAISQLGVSPCHRKTFAGVKEHLS